MKRIDLFQNKKNEHYIEIPKSIIVDDEVMKINHIGQVTLLQNLPEE